MNNSPNHVDGFPSLGHDLYTSHTTGGGSIFFVVYSSLSSNCEQALIWRVIWGTLESLLAF